MTYEEALETINVDQVKKMLEMVKAEEKHHFLIPLFEKQIEFYQIASEAINLQIAKKPVYSEYDDNGFDEIIPYRAECPTCGNDFEFGTWNDEENHHCICGQVIDWSEE